MRSAQTSPHLAPTTEVARPEEAIILYTGEHAYAHDGWITVLPLDRLCGNVMPGTGDTAALKCEIPDEVFTFRADLCERGLAGGLAAG